MLAPMYYLNSVLQLLLLVLLSGCMANAEGCETLTSSIDVNPSSRPDLVALYAKKHQIYEEVMRRNTDSLRECPVIFRDMNIEGAVASASSAASTGPNRARDRADFQAKIEPERNRAVNYPLRII
jgi:hypothetical protein